MVVKNEYPIRVEDLSIGYDGVPILTDLHFKVKKGSIFVIMGGSGSGKSSLLKHLIGLKDPLRGKIYYDDLLFSGCCMEDRKRVLRRTGVTYQSGALWSTLTLLENVRIPLREFTDYTDSEISDIAHLKLALVGLTGYENYYPSEISGGMQKRAALARAMALDPDFLYFDEPSAGLDPISSRRLDELIVQLRDGFGTTIIMVTHELDSILSIGDEAIFLDPETKTLLDSGPPQFLKDQSEHAKIRHFLSRGETYERAV